MGEQTTCYSTQTTTVYPPTSTSTLHMNTTSSTASKTDVMTSTTVVTPKSTSSVPTPSTSGTICFDANNTPAASACSVVSVNPNGSNLLLPPTHGFKVQLVGVLACTILLLIMIASGEMTSLRVSFLIVDVCVASGYGAMGTLLGLFMCEIALGVGIVLHQVVLGH